MRLSKAVRVNRHLTQHQSNFILLILQIRKDSHRKSEPSQVRFTQNSSLSLIATISTVSALVFIKIH